MDSKDYFNKIAKNWDDMRKGFFSETVREKAFKLSKIEKGKIAADIGAGTGFITQGLIDRGLKVVAFDQSEEMINEMKKKFLNSL